MAAISPYGDTPVNTVWGFHHLVFNRHTRGMDIQELRRERLREWIRLNYDSVVMRFCQAVGKAQSQMADMLDGRKSFGEKVARDLEKLAHMPPLYLDTDPGSYAVREPTMGYHGIQLTRAGALLAAEWEKLDISDRVEMESEILTRVAKGVRARRKTHKPDRPTKQ